jgi:hypothetical protein
VAGVFHAHSVRCGASRDARPPAAVASRAGGGAEVDRCADSIDPPAPGLIAPGRFRAGLLPRNNIDTVCALNRAHHLIANLHLDLRVSRIKRRFMTQPP